MLDLFLLVEGVVFVIDFNYMLIAHVYLLKQFEYIISVYAVPLMYLARTAVRRVHIHRPH